MRRPYRAHLFPSAQLPIVPFQPRCSLEPLWPGCQMPQSFPQRLATPVPCLSSGQGHPPPAAPNAGPPPHSPLPAVAAPRPSPPRQCSAGTPAASETGITGAAPDGHRPCPSPPQWPGPRRCPDAPGQPPPAARLGQSRLPNSQRPPGPRPLHRGLPAIPWPQPAFWSITHPFPASPSPQTPAPAAAPAAASGTRYS